MRDKKDNATFDLPGFEPAAPLDPALAPTLVTEPKRGPRPRRATLKQEQLQLLEETDTTGLPVWRRDDNLDLTGLPVWAPATPEA
ncbi:MULTISPECIES: hypothetical protein [unclassified Massilia]|uniref:hypothetical protein n=1 Tax=unclassified Massilia TaxID=2609279 RepID=UPI001B846390|nr:MULTISPECIES: hypothetical protein [unclassified Massilia]MBQ5941647.1 hypothetical protein [Massilia sp. AB1]MBQ5962548.1 hypothetical protein [Massilia sp. ZL223]